MGENRLVLIDLDGVLIESVGYNLALRATVDRFAALMGQDRIHLSDQEVAGFYACGITSEFISAPMCVAALLIQALSLRPDLQRSELPGTMEAIRHSRLRVSRPDFQNLGDRVRPELAAGVEPARAVGSALRDISPIAVRGLIDELMQDVYSVRSLTTRTFQQFALGRVQFERTYRMPAEIGQERSLLSNDVPLLRSELVAKLRACGVPGFPGVAVFTARPSLSPVSTRGGHFSPEAELALEVLGLDGQVPYTAGGHMVWLAAVQGRSPADYIKPSPVHALAAIATARSGELLTSLEASAHLYEAAELRGPLEQLKSERTEVLVFEDSTAAIQSVRKAVERLALQGIDIRCTAVGVAADEARWEALSRVADRVVPSINEGLELEW